MILIIERTGEVLELDGLPVRVWKGTTPDGNPCDVYVLAIAADDERAQRELAAVLVGRPRPAETLPLWALPGTRSCRGSDQGQG